MPIVLDSFSKSLIGKKSDIKLDGFSKSLLETEDEVPLDVPEETVVPQTPAPDPRASLTTTQKILTDPRVSSVIDGLTKGLQTVTGMAPQEQIKAADRSTEFLKSVPRMAADSVPQISDFVNPPALLNRVANTLGTVSAPFMPAYQGGVSGISAALSGQSLPQILQAVGKGVADPMGVPMLTGTENIPLMPFERQGGVETLIPRATINALEQLALGHLMFGNPVGKAVENVKVEGVKRDFEADFAKIKPEEVKAKMAEADPAFQKLTPEQQDIAALDAMSFLKQKMQENPEVGDYYRSKQTLPKLAGDLEMNVRQGLKADLPLKPGERGSTGVPEERPFTPEVPSEQSLQPKSVISEANLGKVINEVRAETIEDKAAREVQELASTTPGAKKTFGFSPDVYQYLKVKPNIEALGEKLAAQIQAKDFQKVINSNLGVIRKTTPITTTEESLLKRELQQEQVASNQGRRAGRKEMMAELKNAFGNSREAMRRQMQMQRLKDDIIARDQQTAKLGTLKAKMEGRLENEKRQGELKLLEEDIKNRDIQRGDKRVKDMLISYIKDNLPKDERGGYLEAVNKARTMGDTINTFRRVDAHVTNIERKELVNQLKTESSKAMESGKVAVEYKKMIEEIMGGIELKKRRPDTLDRLRRTREHIERQRVAGKDIEMPDRILNQLEILHRRSADQMTVGELKNILGNIQDFTKLGETKLKSRQAIYEAQRERITNDLISGTMALDKNPVIVAEPGEKLTPMQKFQNVFHSLNQNLQHLDLVITPMDTFFDLMDGGHATFDGPNYRHYKKQMDASYQSFLRDSNTDAQLMISLAHELKLDDQNFERIGIYAQTVQEGGRQKLLDRGMTEKQINAIDLTDAEMKWYRAGRKKLEELRPDIEETMKNVWNKPLGHVKNYWPMMTDFEKLTETEIFERFGESMPEIVHPTKKTAQGFTKSRTRGYQPIKINAMDVLLKHLDDAHYLVNMSRDIKMLSEVASNPEVKKVTGDLGTALTKEWLDLMARKGGIAGQTRIQALDILRRNFGLAQLGLNVGSALIQPTALLDGAAVIGNHAFDGLYQVISNPKVGEFILENMPELKSRLGEDPAFADFGDSAFLTKAGEVGYAPLKYFDAKTAMGIAYGSYVKKMKEIGKEIDFENPNKEAISYAQEIVRQTQSSGLFKDSPPAISRGKLSGNKSFDKALTQFQSFMLTRWNTIRNRIWRANIRGGRDSNPGSKDFRKAILAVSMLTLALMSETLIRRGVKLGTDKLTGKVTEEKSSIGEDFFQNLVGTIPFIGQMISMAVYKSDPIPSFSGVRKVAEGVGSAVKKVTGKDNNKDNRKMLVNAAVGVGSILGVPGTAQAAKLIKSDIDSGSGGNVVDLYEKALRTENDDEFKKIRAKADEMAVKNRILKEDAIKTAEGRIRKEIIDLYERAILNGDKAIVKKADKIAKVAGFDESIIGELEERAQKRIDKRAEKDSKIEDQSRLGKKDIFDEAKSLMSSFK